MIKTMIVDDSVMMRNVIRSMLTKWCKFEITATAENGKVALANLNNFKNLDLILLDIEMPEMDGLEFLKNARLRTKAKIVILSSVAIAGSPYAAKARMLGADAIITKPSGSVSLNLAQHSGDEIYSVLKKLFNLSI